MCIRDRCIHTGWPSHVHNLECYTQGDPVTWNCFRKLKHDLECIHTKWPNHMTLFEKAEMWLGVHTHKMTQSHAIVSESWNMTWSTYMQEHPITWHCFRKLKHARTSNHMTLFQEAEARLGVHSHRPVGWPDQREVGGSAGVSIAHTVKSMPNWLFFLWTNEQIKLTGQKNNIAQPNTDKWFSFSLHFSPFLIV